VGASAGFGKVLVDEKERKEKNGARSGPPKIEEREREREKGGKREERSKLDRKSYSVSMTT
jgi:hypothetical protein